MKAALYARVSMDEKSNDRRFQDLDNQLIPLREEAQRRGYEVVAEYTDKESGANPARAGFRAVLNDYAVKGYSVIFVWKLDRFSREPLFVQTAYIQKLRLAKVGVISLTESWLDTRAENPFADLILSVMAWAAGEERRKISERTKAGIKRLRAIGQWKGGRPRKGGVVNGIGKTL